MNPSTLPTRNSGFIQAFETEQARQRQAILSDPYAAQTYLTKRKYFEERLREKKLAAVVGPKAYGRYLGDQLRQGMTAWKEIRTDLAREWRGTDIHMKMAWGMVGIMFLSNVGMVGFAVDQAALTEHATTLQVKNHRLAPAHVGYDSGGIGAMAITLTCRTSISSPVRSRTPPAARLKCKSPRRNLIRPRRLTS
jgi:hypothetical protein